MLVLPPLVFVVLMLVVCTMGMMGSRGEEGRTVCSRTQHPVVTCIQYDDKRGKTGCQ
jgi:hypothetical protein